MISCLRHGFDFYENGNNLHKDNDQDVKTYLILFKVCY